MAAWEGLIPQDKTRVSTLFDIHSDETVVRFPPHSGPVPPVDETYCFHPPTTRALIVAFKHNRRMLIHGVHGTGKSSHIEQVAARLRWPCVRVNLDGHMTRMDLIGKDGVELEDGQPITRFYDGILPWAMQRPVALILDEYDAARPDLMFVLQQVLEAKGQLILPDQSRVLLPHPYFRLFATANTSGLGDWNGAYHGTQVLNQGQLDRWQMVCALNYLPEENELSIVASKCPGVPNDTLRIMVQFAKLTRNAYAQGDLSALMSPRTVIHWAENYLLFNDLRLAFQLSFYHRVDGSEQTLLEELFQRCTGEEWNPS